MNVMVVDNIDSFVYNLVQYLGVLEANPYVVKKTAAEEDADEEIADADAVVLSPGPGKPPDAGISNYVLKEYADELPILGVCLGHQCIAEAYGGKVTYAKTLMHGKTSRIKHNGRELFKDTPSPFEATRYHSLMVEKETLPRVLEVTAESMEDGEIMALRHRDHPVYGVQFHPESVLTKHGMKIMKNFLEASR